MATSPPGSDPASDAEIAADLRRLMADHEPGTVTNGVAIAATLRTLSAADADLHRVQAVIVGAIQTGQLIDPLELSAVIGPYPLMPAYALAEHVHRPWPGPCSICGATA